MSERLEPVRHLRRDELGSAAATLARAFDADPLFRFLLVSDRARARWLLWLQAHALRQAFACGGAFTTTDPGACAIGLFPVGAWPAGFRNSFSALTMPPGLPPLRLLGVGGRIERRVLASHPTEPHVYIYVLGVHPDRKGAGLGGTLVRHACALADAANVQTHLETSNPVNVPMYQHFGFEVREELALPGAPPVWVMRRPCAKSPK